MTTLLRWTIPLVVGAAAAWAQPSEADVTLSASAGPFSITGTLLRYDGATWRLDTAYGPLTFDAAAMRCTAGACPPEAAAHLAISGEALAGRVLLPALIAGYARAADLTIVRTDPAPDRERFDLAREGELVLSVDLRLTTTAEGIADLLAHEADVAVAARPVRNSERFLAEDAGLGRLDDPARMRVLAAGARTPIVAPGNPLRAIPLSRLADVLAGRVTDWAALGGAPGPIRLHLLGPGAGDVQGTADRLLRPAGLTFAEAVRHPDAAALAAAVAADPGALGLVRTGQEGPAERLALTGACGAESQATPGAVARGDHPLDAPLWLLLPPRRLAPAARDLLAWMTGPAAQPIVRRAGFLDRASPESPLSAQGARLVRAVGSAGPEVSLADLQEMLSALEGRARLGTTIRFAGGGTTIDRAGQDAVRGLAARLVRGEMAGRSLLLAGFSDGVGDAPSNARLSMRRAEAARTALVAAVRRAAVGRPPPAGAVARAVAASLAADPVREEGGATILTLPGGEVRLEVEGFGEALPILCDDTALERHVNRRVEIWATP